MIIDKVLPGIWRIEVPLPQNPLRNVNAYALPGRDRNLVVDTGFNCAESETALRDGLEELGFDLDRTDFFITHLHGDHLALVKKIATPASKVFMGVNDIETLMRWKGWGDVVPLALKHGFQERGLAKSFNSVEGLRFTAELIPDFTPLESGHLFEVGNYSFSCIETPGHTPGHMCLFEPEEGLLISGDHILGEISPNINGWSPGSNPLAEYLTSLDATRSLPARMIAPGHRQPFAGLNKRIGELIAHHMERLEEVSRILRGGPLTAFEIASKMTWDMKERDWTKWPPSQQWFATGEALAHLNWLVDEHYATIEDCGSKLLFVNQKPFDY